MKPALVTSHFSKLALLVVRTEGIILTSPVYEEGKMV